MAHPLGAEGEGEHGRGRPDSEEDLHGSVTGFDTGLNACVVVAENPAAICGGRVLESAYSGRRVEPVICNRRRTSTKVQATNVVCLVLDQLSKGCFGFEIGCRIRSGSALPITSDLRPDRDSP